MTTDTTNALRALVNIDAQLATADSLVRTTAAGVPLTGDERLKLVGLRDAIAALATAQPGAKPEPAEAVRFAYAALCEELAAYEEPIAHVAEAVKGLEAEYPGITGASLATRPSEDTEAKPEGVDVATVKDVVAKYVGRTSRIYLYIVNDLARAQHEANKARQAQGGGEEGR